MTGGIYSWTTVPIDNERADFPQIDWIENQDPDTVNNSSRGMMARHAEFVSDLSGKAITTGTGNDYALTTQVQIDPAQGYFDGLIIGFTADRTNTDAATINVTPQGLTALGPTPMKALAGRELASGEVQAGGFYIGRHDGTQFVLVGSFAGTITADRLSADLRGRLKQAGDTELWWGDAPDLATEKPGYLICDGSEYSRTLPLFNFWGVKFGAGNGTTTANLLDVRGLFIRILDPTATVDPDVLLRTDRGDGTGGAATGAGQGHALEAHGHVVTDDGHTHPPGLPGAFEQSASPGNKAAKPPGLGGQEFASTGSSTANISIADNSVTGAATAAAETRVKNKACHLIVLADPEAAAGPVTLARTSGYGYTFDSVTTIAQPPIGQVRLNDPVFANVTQAAINVQTAEDTNPDIAAVIENWGVAPSANKRTIKFSKAQTATFAEYTLTGVTGSGAWRTLDLTHVGSNSAFVNGEPLTVDAGGATGVGIAGPPGPNVGLDYQWNTAQTGDPGSGKALLNAAGTMLSISKTNRQGQSNAGNIATWSASTNPANRGHVRVLDVAAPGTNFKDLHVTGVVVDQTTYFDIPVTQVEDQGTLANNDTMAITFAPAGDKGLDGAGSGDVVGPATSTANAVPGFANTTGKLLQNTPVTIVPANGNMAGIGTLAASGNISTTSTGANTAPVGTTAQGPAAAPGLYRYDSTLARWRFVTNGAWATSAELEIVNAFVKGQRKTITVLTSTGGPPPVYTPNLDDSNDFDLGAAFTEARQLNIPTQTTALALNTSIAGEITYSTGVGGSLTFGGGWNFPDNTAITVGASETGTLYFRVANLAAGIVYRIAKHKWTA